MLAIDILKKTTSEEQTRYKHLTACYQFANELLDTIDLTDEIKTKILNTVLLHDIGYSEVISNIGNHFVDGYNYLNENYPDICYHKAILLHSDFVNTCNNEYKELVTSVYDSLTDLEFAVLILLDYCDTHIDGVGNEVTIEGRWADLENRHGNNIPKMNIINELKSYAYHIESIVDRILDSLPKLS